MQAGRLLTGWSVSGATWRQKPARSDEMTRFIYALKEIRARIEAELLTDLQHRLAQLSRDMDNHNGQRIPHQPALSRS
jgi:hypothetical protein